MIFYLLYFRKSTTYERNSKPKPRPSWSSKPDYEYHYEDRYEVRKRNGFGKKFSTITHQSWYFFRQWTSYHQLFLLKMNNECKKWPKLTRYLNTTFFFVIIAKLFSCWTSRSHTSQSVSPADRSTGGNCPPDGRGRRGHQPRPCDRLRDGEETQEERPRYRHRRSGGNIAGTGGKDSWNAGDRN